MGGYYDKLVAAKLPPGASVKEYSDPAATSQMTTALNAAKGAAGPEIINVTLVIPIILIVAFAGLFLYKRSQKQKNVIVQTA